tara:strand:+ start:45 stop:278 length:234 start_codon:yes stop_codon:yes gene_type:complete
MSIESEVIECKGSIGDRNNYFAITVEFEGSKVTLRCPEREYYSLMKADERNHYYETGVVDGDSAKDFFKVLADKINS